MRRDPLPEVMQVGLRIEKLGVASKAVARHQIQNLPVNSAGKGHRLYFRGSIRLLMTLRLSAALAATVLALAACGNRSSKQTHGPILLGDSATIVTEQDSARLLDGMADLKPTSGNEDESNAMPTRDTARIPAATPTTAPAAGLTAAFKEVSLTLTGLTAREKPKAYGTARGASFTLAGGNLAGSTLQASGGTISKVTQRYSTVIAVQDGADKLMLDNLSNTGNWQTLQGPGGAYSLAGLDAPKLEYRNAKPAEIRSAVQQAARKQKLSRQDTQEWLDAVKGINAANQSPCVVVLKSVTWRVEGKDAAGKSFSKELRIDVPL